MRSTLLQGWKDEAEWVLKDKVWDKVTFDNLFTTTVESTETTETTESSTTDNAVTENTEAVEGTESVQ
jgi:foldase protein PrsA